MALDLFRKRVTPLIPTLTTVEFEQEELELDPSFAFIHEFSPNTEIIIYTMELLVANQLNSGDMEWLIVGGINSNTTTMLLIANSVAGILTPVGAYQISFCPFMQTTGIDNAFQWTKFSYPLYLPKPATEDDFWILTFVGTSSSDISWGEATLILGYQEVV